MTNEAFYDAEIAPKLLEIAKACEDRGMSFVALVEYASGETGETCTLAPRDVRSIKPEIAYWGVRCRGNIDAFMMAAEKHAREFGHSSLYLSIRGIPTTPAPQKEGGR